MLYKLFLITN